MAKTVKINWKRGETFKEVEKKLILACYKANDKNKTATSLELGISVKTVYNKLKEYGAL